MKLIIVSGRSGSGKSICLHVLEDLGYYCIDNLPIALLLPLVNELREQYQYLAVSIDARNSTRKLDILQEIVRNLRTQNISTEILYLDADDETLIYRYRQTHRKHPLIEQSPSLAEAIEIEKTILEPIINIADQTINTNQLTVQQLRELLYERLQLPEVYKLSILLLSFGYKFGIPRDIDFLFDARCLPNPFWEAGLGRYTGKDKCVEQFLEQHAQTHELLADISQFIDKWAPNFANSNRRYLTIGIGCTGGQHRSVYISEKLYQHLSQEAYNVQLRHRELT